MFILTNLYHEVHQTERERKRDPLKLGLYLMTLIGIVMVGYYFLRMSQIHASTADYRTARGEWTKLEGEQTDAAKKETEGNALIANALKLFKDIEQQPQVTPLLNALGRLTGKNIQLIKFSFGVEGNKGLAIVQGVNYALETKDGENSARPMSEEYRLALNNMDTERDDYVARFTSLDEAEPAVFDGEKYVGANFTITIQFTPKGITEVAPNPVQRPRKAL